jgi:ribonuclease HI
MLIIYTDGSYKNGKIGWAFVGCIPTEAGGLKIIKQANGIVTDPKVQKSNQIAGELKAVMCGLAWAINKKEQDIEVRFDYVGCREWALNHWGAKKPVAKRYKSWTQGVISKFKLRIKWTHVEGHSNEPLNDMADALAKAATEGHYV